MNNHQEREILEVPMLPKISGDQIQKVVYLMQACPGYYDLIKKEYSKEVEPEPGITVKERLEDYVTNARSYGLECKVEKVIDVPPSYKIIFTINNIELAKSINDQLYKAVGIEPKDDLANILNNCVDFCKQDPDSFLETLYLGKQMCNPILGKIIFLNPSIKK